jgi:hypothetical protein
MTRENYILHWAKELKKLIDKRTKLSERYQSQDTSHKQKQKLNAELNWQGMYIAQAEERLCFALGQLLPENAQSEYRPSPFHCYKGISEELKKTKFD